MPGPDDDAFCHRVSEALALAYRLLEGPALTSDSIEVVVAQALVRPAPSAG